VSTAAGREDVTLAAIIPAKDASATLSVCLAALRGGSRPPDEIIVFDDGSRDDTAAVARAEGATVVGHRGPARGPAHGRNRAAGVANSELLMFVDADVVVHPDTVATAIAAFGADPSIAACFGSYDDQPAAAGFVAQYKNLMHHYVHQCASERATTFWAGCGAVRRTDFEAVGGFDESFLRPSVEDIELGLRLTGAGKHIRLDKRMLATHLKAWTLAGMVRSDIFDRALPWVRLIHRHGAWRDRQLNVDDRHRISAALLGLAALAGVGSLAKPTLGAAAPILAAAALLPHWRVLSFMTEKRGIWFGLRAAPTLWLYLAYSTAAGVVGTVMFATDELS